MDGWMAKVRAMKYIRPKSREETEPSIHRKKSSILHVTRVHNAPNQNQIPYTRSPNREKVTLLRAPNTT